MGVAAGEIGTGGAVIGHEQRVADKRGITDLIGDIRRRVARRVDHFGVEFADLEVLAVLEQMVEIAAVDLEISGIENRPEDALHVLDVLTDADLRPGLGLDVRRAGQVVGMGVRLKGPDDA